MKRPRGGRVAFTEKEGNDAIAAPFCISHRLLHHDLSFQSALDAAEGGLEVGLGVGV